MNNPTPATAEYDAIQRKKMLFSIFAIFGISSGFLAPFFGLLCIIAHALLPGDMIFNRIGTVLMMIGIPLLLAGSHFLDKVEELNRNA